MQTRMITRYGHLAHIHTSAPDAAGNTYLLLVKAYKMADGSPGPTNAEVLRRSPSGALTLLHVFGQDERAQAQDVPWRYAAGVPISIVGKQAYGSVQPNPLGGLWVDLSTRVDDVYGERQAWIEIRL
jgi:hypothetical protein